MSNESVFADEWRECLRVHYMDVCRREDVRTGETLTRVMFEVGFSERDLAELRVCATMRADDVAPDFVPDMDVLEEVQEHPEPQESVEDSPYVMAVPDLPQPDMLEESPVEVEEIVEDDESPDDPDAAQQLSLF